MDSQIIISREDHTDFLSLGYIQTDTSLVSALGGALASFAEEIGLGGDKSSTESKRNSSINLSRFPNGVIASKMVVVGEQTPVILVNSFAGNILANEALKFVLQKPSQLINNLLIIKLSDYSFSFQPY